MLKKIRSLAYEHAIPAAFIIFIVFDLLLLGVGQLLSLLPKTLPIQFLSETIIMILPAALVVFFGFSGAFKKGNFLRGILCILPYLGVQLFTMWVVFSKMMVNTDAVWQPWYQIVYGLFAVFGVGFREECIYRATIQNVLAKKYANSVKGIWITVMISSIIFGLSHAPNLFFGVAPLAVLIQIVKASAVGLLFGAVYLRSGNIWVLILVHTLTDTVSLAQSIFLQNVTDVDLMSQQSFSWIAVVFELAYIGITIFLLRPSKCKQICESLCFADKK